jgi:hypothetical protein
MQMTTSWMTYCVLVREHIKTNNIAPSTKAMHYATHWSLSASAQQYYGFRRQGECPLSASQGAHAAPHTKRVQQDLAEVRESIERAILTNTMRQSASHPNRAL